MHNPCVRRRRRRRKSCFLPSPTPSTPSTRRPGRRPSLVRLRCMLLLPPCCLYPPLAGFRFFPVVRTWATVYFPLRREHTYKSTTRPCVLYWSRRVQPCLAGGVHGVAVSAPQRDDGQAQRRVARRCKRAGTSHLLAQETDTPRILQSDVAHHSIRAWPFSDAVMVSVQWVWRGLGL